MVNRSRNNAKTRRRSRRGGDAPPLEVNRVDPNLSPYKTKDDINNKDMTPSDIKSSETDESWSSSISSGFGKLTDGAKNLVGENEGEKGTLSSMTDSVTGFFSSEPTVESKQQVAEPVVAVSVVEPKPWYRSFFGGKRGSRRRQQQGGRGLGLTYYATPVNGLRVAEPTYMEYYKGGKRRNTKRRTRRCKSKRCKKTCRKQHRHKRK